MKVDVKRVRSKCHAIHYEKRVCIQIGPVYVVIDLAGIRQVLAVRMCRVALRRG